jgi:diguanylate cyclase (GGDEF)-like protein
MATVAPGVSTRAMANVAAVLWGGGAVVSLAIATAPNPQQVAKPAFLVTGLAAAIVAAVLRMRAGRLPVAALQGCALLGTALISLCVAFSATRSGPPAGVEMLYLWTVLCSAYFFSRRHTAAHIALAAICYGAVLAVSTPGASLFTRWMTVVGSLAVAAALVAALRERVVQLVERLADAARTDPLTGLHNRRGFEDGFGLTVEQARMVDRPLSLLVGDVDHFKTVNDRLGHPGGDAALVRVGRLLVAELRDSDAVARTGGEEFALILPNTSETEAYAAAERLRRVVEKSFAGDPVELTMSFGLATYPQHGVTADGLLAAADKALYAAKELGRNRSVIYSDEISSLVGSRSAPSEVHLATVLSLAEALDLRDSGTADHSQTVGRYCGMIAEELGLPPWQVKRVETAGVLHDVGKIGLPDAILRKPGRLTDDEWLPMRRHPEIGARILGDDNFADIRSWVLAHHERPDGKGYPYGLLGDEIPLEARILAVADAYEAMTAVRPYRAPLAAREARAELLRCTGSQFDPRVVAAFLAAIGRERANAAVLELAG